MKKKTKKTKKTKKQSKNIGLTPERLAGIQSIIGRALTKTELKRAHRAILMIELYQILGEKVTKSMVYDIISGGKLI